jgi:hypothetical protein
MGEENPMKRRGLAIRVAVVAVVAAAGLGVAASPASAMSSRCEDRIALMGRMAQTMQESEVGSKLWIMAFDTWNLAARNLLRFCADG